MIYVLGLSAPIASGTVNSTGSFDVDANLPSTLVGRAVIQVNGYATPLAVRSVSLGIRITGKPQGAERILMRSVKFDIFSPVLTPKTKKVLRSIARKVGSESAEVSTIGYTQGVGVLGSALRLSRERASAVNGFLKAKGIRGDFTGRGLGNRGPQADDRTAVVTVRFRASN